MVIYKFKMDEFLWPLSRYGRSQFLLFFKLKDHIDLFSFDKDKHVYMENEICILFCC